VRADGKELRLATQIIDALESDWKPDKYHDTYTEELRELIARRAKGETVTVEEAPAETAKVVDLMAALNASVEAAKRGRKGSMSKAFERAARELVPREDDEDEAAERPARRRQKSSARKSSRSKTGRTGASKTRPARRGATRKSA
jgi:DNA end-binding protein Ku